MFSLPLTSSFLRLSLWRLHLPIDKVWNDFSILAQSLYKVGLFLICIVGLQYDNVRIREFSGEMLVNFRIKYD